MSSPSLLGCSLEEESPLVDKYYLQLTENSLLELLREAVKCILIYDLPLQELPILHLQKEFYPVQEHSFLKEHDILDTIKHEFRETAEWQKKFLDMSFTLLEDERSAFSDMRDPQEDPWSISWNKYRAADTEESLRKSYGVVANLFCNNYATLLDSIREISRLLEHLHLQGLIPPIDGEKLEESLLEIVAQQFFLNCDFLDLHKVLPIMAQSHKENFVFSSAFGMDTRKKISKYAMDEAMYDMFFNGESSPFLGEDDNKQEVKRMIQEGFLKDFTNTNMFLPLLDENGQFKPFDFDIRNYMGNEEGRAESEIDRFLAKQLA